jgi:hypothetical protein
VSAIQFVFRQVKVALFQEAEDLILVDPMEVDQEGLPDLNQEVVVDLRKLLIQKVEGVECYFQLKVVVVDVPFPELVEVMVVLLPLELVEATASLFKVDSEAVELLIKVDLEESLFKVDLGVMIYLETSLKIGEVELLSAAFALICHPQNIMEFQTLSEF